MADESYLTDPNQAPAQLADLGPANLTALSDGTLTTMPGLADDETNWYYDFFGPSYLDYYNWSPFTNPGPVGVIGSTSGCNSSAATDSSGSSNSSGGPYPTVQPAPTAPTSGAGSAGDTSGGGALTSPLSPITVVIQLPAPGAPSAASGSAVSAPSSAPPSDATASSSTATSTTPPATTPPPIATTTATAPPSTASTAVAPAPAPNTITPAVLSAPILTPRAVISAAPRDQMLTAVTQNPRFRARETRAHEALIEEMADDESLFVRVVERSATPVAFAVPQGCDSVEFSHGTIEATELGDPDDLAQVVSLGTPMAQTETGDEVTSLVGGLTPGQALMVTVPWRAPSFVSLPANHLRARLVARFYANLRPLDG